MGLLDRLESRMEAKASTSLELFREIYGANASWTGKVVNYKTALQVSTVFACVRVIAEGIAQVPFKLIRESADGKTKTPATEHPLYEKLHRRPNFFQTSFEYREMLGMHAVLCGAHYSFINRVNGQPYELLPFQPQCVEVRQDPATWEVSYKVTPPGGGEARIFPAESVFVVRGPSWNGYLGLQAVELAREAIGLALATEESHARMHKNGARVGGLISVEGALTDKQYKEMHGWVEKHFQGPANAYNTMILDRGSKFTQAAQSGVESQHLETRRYQVEEICRALRVMPIMVGYSDKASTYASAEQMFLAHLVHTLAPWYERIEQAVSAQLLTDKDRKSGLSPKFIEEGLLRGSLEATKDFLIGMVNGGIMTPNEGRSKLDLNPAADEASDKLRVPVNLSVDPQGDAHRESVRQADAAKGLGELRDQVQQLQQRQSSIHVDARSTVNVPERGVTVNNKNDVTVPERAVTVNSTNEVTVPERAVTVNNKSFPAESVETIERGADHEISAIHRKNKD